MSVKKTVKKRSVKIEGHLTSFSLEDAFWDQLKLIAKRNNVAISGLINQIDKNRRGNLSSAIRIYVLENKVKNLKGNN